MSVLALNPYQSTQEIASEPTVLIVDDNPHDIDLVRIAFEMSHIAVRIDAVMDSSHAVARLHDALMGPHRPNLIILDLHMPHLDGCEVITAMRKEGLLHQIPVVMLSSSRQALDHQRCLHAGARAFYQKPECLEDLVTLATHLSELLDESHK
jgi:CheY-like chemotaxis protein